MEDTFASLLLMRWSPLDNTLTYANAGHCRPVLVGKKTSSVVTYSDIILGLDPQAEFSATLVSAAMTSTRSTNGIRCLTYSNVWISIAGRLLM